MESGGVEVDWSAPTLLPGGRLAGATGTDTGTPKAAAAGLPRLSLAPRGLCPSPSGLSTCLEGLQNSMPNTCTQRRDSSLRETASWEQGPLQSSIALAPSPSQAPTSPQLRRAERSLTPPHLWILLPSRGRPLVTVETHVAVQPLLCIEHLAAVLADVSAPWLFPACGAPAVLLTVGRCVRRQGREDAAPPPSPDTLTAPAELKERR